MSLSKKRFLTPIPPEGVSGQFAQVLKQYNGNARRIVRRFEVRGGEQLFPDNLEDWVFDPYGTVDGVPVDGNEVTPRLELTFPNAVLEEQRIVRSSTKDNPAVVEKVYQEAFDTVREIERPVFTVDENNRNLSRRTYVILNTAPDANKKGEIGLLEDEDGGLWLTREQRTQGNAVTIIQRDFIEATSELVQVGQDDFSYTSNGLLRLRRQFIALKGADIGDDDIGVDTTVVNGKTLYLAGLETDENEVVVRVTKQWVEAGTLSITTRNLAEGVRQVAYSFLGVEGTVEGSIVSRTIGDFEGIRTFNVTAMQSKDGGDIVGEGGDPKLAHNYRKLIGFTRPGIAAIETRVVEYQNISGVSPTGIDLIIFPPAQCKVNAFVEVYFQESEETNENDFPIDPDNPTFPMAYWNPSSWAWLEAFPNAADDLLVGNVIKGLRGYRVIDSGDVQYESGTLPFRKESGEAESDSVLLLTGYGRFFGRVIPSAIGGPDVVVGEASLSGGPPRPEGKWWGLDIDIRPAFETTDGKMIYKKTVVYGYVPDFDRGETVFNPNPEPDVIVS